MTASRGGKQMTPSKAEIREMDMLTDLFTKRRITWNVAITATLSFFSILNIVVCEAKDSMTLHRPTSDQVEE